MARLGRYTVGARCYDVASLERPVYRVGREAAIGLLELHPGDRVLDLGCGTGLNFPLLDAAVGPSGSIVGVDLSGSMLARAHARVRSHGWNHVCLVQANAATADLRAIFRDDGYDAIVATYTLSVIEDAESAWRNAMVAAHPGARVAVADLALPQGRWRVLAPLARLACFTGGADLHRHPWEWVARGTDNPQRRVLRGGHVHVAAGTVRS